MDKALAIYAGQGCSINLDHSCIRRIDRLPDPESVSGRSHENGQQYRIYRIWYAIYGSIVPLDIWQIVDPRFEELIEGYNKHCEAHAND